MDVEIKSVSVHVKVCDAGHYDLKDDRGTVIASRNEDYVPDFFPGDHYGDYLILDIDIETGQILNWKKPTAEKVLEAFEPENAT